MSAMRILFTFKRLAISNATLAELLILILIHLSKSAGDRSELTHPEKVYLFSCSFMFYLKESTTLGDTG